MFQDGGWEMAAPAYNYILTNSLYTMHILSYNFYSDFHALPCYQPKNVGALRDGTANALNMMVVENERYPSIPLSL